MEASAKKTMGIIISSLRKDQGMTQADLAEKMGVTDKAVSKWERDLSYPDIASLPKLAEVLGTSINVLMEPTDVTKGKVSPKAPAHIIDLLLRALALAMGISVCVLAILKQIDPHSGFILLGIGLASIAIYSLRERS